MPIQWAVCRSCDVFFSFHFYCPCMEGRENEQKQEVIQDVMSHARPLFMRLLAVSVIHFPLLYRGGLLPKGPIPKASHY